MILTKEQLAEVRAEMANDISPDEIWAEVQVRNLLETLDAQAQTIAELTSKLDAVRSVAEHLKKKAWDDGICRDCDLDEQADELLSILDAPTKPKEARNE